MQYSALPTNLQEPCMCMCVCVRACVPGCVPVCVRAFVSICVCRVFDIIIIIIIIIIQHEYDMRHQIPITYRRMMFTAR